MRQPIRSYSRFVGGLVFLKREQTTADGSMTYERQQYIFRHTARWAKTMLLQIKHFIAHMESNDQSFTFQPSLIQISASWCDPGIDPG